MHSTDLTGDRLACRVGDHGQLIELRDLETGASLLGQPGPLCLFEGVDGAATATATHMGVRLNWTSLPGGATATLHLTTAGPTLRLRLEAVGQSGECRVRFPFVDALRLSHDPQAPDRVYGGADGFRDGQGRPIFRRSAWPLPTARVAPDGRSLTFLPAPGADVGLAEPYTLRLESDRPAVFEAELRLHGGGWPAAWALFRDRVRSLFDLSQYQRPEVAWYQDQFVQHFTFLYGREILNLETGRLELDRFLDEAERDFGGYDGMLLWGVYPRLGIDERTQWDFYDDLPGGREGLRDLSRRARERGVRVFVPYKPWDRSAELHGQPAPKDHEELARLVADAEADGIFLDTMSAISPEFRAALDRARPGVVFCSEGRAKGKAFEVITGSWDQTSLTGVKQSNWSAPAEVMPGVDMWRFVFPEHRLFVTSRHAMGNDRIRLIQRGFFSGMGWVVWQDIFGLALPFTPEEAALLKRCRTIFREHKAALWSTAPTPLMETLVAGVFANEFPATSRRLWTFYNETDRPVDGPVLKIEPRPHHRYVDLWANRELTPDEAGCLHLSLEPRSVGAVAELPEEA